MCYDIILSINLSRRGTRYVVHGMSECQTAAAVVHECALKNSNTLKMHYFNN